MEKRSFFESFKVWFGIGAVMFATGFGANVASGAYAAAYFTPVGGGWAIVWLLIVCVLISFFATISLNFIRSYEITNYNQFFLALWNVHKEDSKPAAKLAVSTFFDVFQVGSSVVASAASVALFGTLMSQLLNISYWVSAILGVIVFAVLTMYGAGFLRKFSSVMSISLIVSCLILLVAVIADRGSVLAERIGNFQIGPDWGFSTPSTTLIMILIFSFSNASVGATLCNFSQKLKTKQDAVGTGITVGFMTMLIFLLTSLIVLPYMPDCFSDAPILTICSTYLGAGLTTVYWIVAILAIVSSIPTMTFAVANRWTAVWKTEKLSQKMKFFVISIVFLVSALLISSVGLMTIVQVFIQYIGYIALFAIVVPLIITIFRVSKNDKAK